MRKDLLFFFVLLSCSPAVFSQVNYTANDSVAPAPTKVRPGYNSGFAAGWSDLSIASMASGDPAQFVQGAGLKTNRDALFFEALEVGGYTSKLDEVNHYLAVGQGDLTALTLGGADGFRPEPPAPFRDTAHYCPTKQSTLFANMYTPIWDGGANGTPYNDTNYYAAYMYKTVATYKDYIQYWEIWNEPGFDFTGNRGWRKPGDPVGNWWDNDPNPCDYKLHAPVQHYVRMLRIAWEVIKTLDPTGHVCMGAPGFPSFVDAVARNTDNPVDGSVTAQYPLKGGAYFDAVCYHSFPHIDGSFVIDQTTGQVLRNSDVGAEAVTGLKNRLEDVLENYGYDGTTYPRKQFLITEINLPRKIFNYTNNTYGGQVAQRNFMMKAFMECKKAKIWAMNVYTFGELRNEAAATDEFDLMGLYLNMDNTNYYTAIATDAGIGMKTMSNLIYDTEHDPVRSAALQNNPNVRIEAFKRPNGKYVYALWAKMKQDFNEIGTASYTFPSNLNITPFLKKHIWTKSITGQTFITGNHDIVVDGTPMFLEEEPNVGQPLADFVADTASFCVPYFVNFSSLSANADSVKWEFSDGSPAISKSFFPSVSYTNPGFHHVKITAYGANGDSSVNEQFYYIHARTVPTASFQVTFNGGNAFFLNTSFDADSVHWDFGDGSTSTEFYPAHTYTTNTNYPVTLQVFNPCGMAEVQDTVEVLYALEVDLQANITSGCAPLSVQYQAQSPLATSWSWVFPGGTPDTSSLANPVVVYNNPGTYPVSLTVANNLTSSTITRQNAITINSEPIASFTQTIDYLTVQFTPQSPGATVFVWDFGDGTSTLAANPTHIYPAPGTYTVTLIAANACGGTSFTQSILVGGATPVAEFTALTSSGCAPLTVQYQDASTALQGAYYWTFAGGTPAQSTDRNPIVLYAQPGTYSAQLIVTNPWGSDTILKQNLITVVGTPTASFTQVIDSLTVSFSFPTQAGVNYVWNFGDGGTSTDLNPVHTYAAPGSYAVQLIAQNFCGADTANQSISITGPAPLAGLLAIPQAGCVPFTVQFTDVSFGATGRQWFFEGGNPAQSTQANPTVIYQQMGEYDVRLISTNAWGSDTLDQTDLIFVGDVPTANFTYVINQDSVFFTNTSQFENNVLWLFGDGTTSTLSDPIHRFASGTFTITLSASNDCGAALFEQTINITSGLDELQLTDHAFSAYPNPVADVFWVKAKDQMISNAARINIFDLSGSLMYQNAFTFSPDGKIGPIWTDHLADGIYLCKLVTQDGVWTTKITKSSY